jgi:hypothetical protein
VHRLPDIIDDPVMRKLVELVQEKLPTSAQEARIHLLKRLGELECEALSNAANTGTLHSIRAMQQFILASDPLMSSTSIKGPP